MHKKLEILLCAAALSLSGAMTLADSSDERGSGRPEMVKDHEKSSSKGKGKDKHEIDHGRDDAGAKGARKGWVDGQPRGQAKKFGKGQPQHKTHKGGEDHADSVDGDKPVPDRGGEPEHQPASSEEILTDIAKGEAARRVGAAPGSAEEALINIGADAIIERTRQREK